MTYTVYVHERGKRPRQVGTADDKAAKELTLTIDGRTFYWATADLTAKTVTYTDWKPQAA